MQIQHGSTRPLKPDLLFAALSDETRRDIARRAVTGEEGVAELARHYPMSFAAVQKHVAVLERAGIVVKQQVGRRKVVRINIDGLRAAQRLLDQYEQLWRDRVARMTGLINEKETPELTVIDIQKDTDALTMTLVAEFDATPERVWQLWADPRQLERWWGPPTYPATFTHHDLRVGGRADYHMTGPEGDQPRGFWELEVVDPPRRLAFQDWFANEDGSPNTDLPLSSAEVTIAAAGEGKTRMTMASKFPDLESMEKLLAMGMEQGLRGAVGQIDAILAEG